MARLQQMLIQFGLINSDGSPRGGRPQQAAPTSQSGGLWTPDGGGSASAALPGSGSGSGKLWVPGMD
jgi:hypothetical protein